MKTVRTKCRYDYNHYFERLNGKWTDMSDDFLDEPAPVVWDREITLECARCGKRIYIDSVARTYLGVTETNWGT